MRIDERCIAGRKQHEFGLRRTQRSGYPSKRAGKIGKRIDNDLCPERHAKLRVDLEAAICADQHRAALGLEPSQRMEREWFEVERLQAFIDTAQARSATARQPHARAVVFR